MPRLPPAHMIPAARDLLYPAFNMLGKAKVAIMTMEAPIMPVVAAKTVAKMMATIPNPPLIEPNKMRRFVNKRSATPEASIMQPIKTKRGKAIRTSLLITPKIAESKTCTARLPHIASPNDRPSPPNTEATGMPTPVPARSKINIAATINSGLIPHQPSPASPLPQEVRLVIASPT